MQGRITPFYITHLKENQIFVFGSNLAGRHGAGAAKTARKWGAEYGNPDGKQGHTYAIPTKDKNVSKALALREISKYVKEFIKYASSHPDLTFLVTEIGCGLSGMQPYMVAPLFKEAVNINNIHLPKRFWDVLLKNH